MEFNLIIRRNDETKQQAFGILLATQKYIYL